MIVALFTSTFLKKKEERTRIAGVIVEKRINSEQEILHFLERELFKEEINVDNSNKQDYVFDELLKKYGLPVPDHGAMQYARIFTSPKLFDKLFHTFEDHIMNHKLWLDTKVKEPLMIKRIPLPKGKELTNEEFDRVHHRILLLMGHCCDPEINQLMSELDEKIVNSVYKLDLSRPKKSIMRDNMYNVDMDQCMRRFQQKTIPGIYQEPIFQLIMDFVYQEKGIHEDRMSDEEFEEFLKSSMPREYEQMKQERDSFEEMLKKTADECGVKIVHKSELDQYPDMYGMSLKEIFDELKAKNHEKRTG